jgi:chromosome segregation ATPase
MTDTDKILQALARLEAGQLTLQETVNQQGKAITGLQEGQKALQTDVQGLQTDVKNLQEGQKTLQTDVSFLKEGQETLDLKVEAFHAEQTKANTQILTMLTDMNEINAKAIDNRVTRIEKHLNLPPLK